MTMGRRPGAIARPALALAAAVSFGFAGSAQAQAPRSASGSVTIVQPVGAGVAYDIRSQVLTAIFLSGQIGEQLSLLLPGKRTGAGSHVSGIHALAAPGNIVVLSSLTVSINLETVEPSSGRIGRDGDTGTMLVLAQFN